LSGVPAQRWVRRATRALADVAGVALLALMLLTVADVVMRYVFHSPISGVWDLTQAAMVLVTFLGLAYGGYTGGHIVIDLLKDRFDARALRALDLFVGILSALVMLVIAWRSSLYMLDVARTGAASMTLLMPFYPLVAVVAFGSLVFAAVLLFRAFRPGDTP
jgi:TRAP-type transport system small permease protein